MDSLDQLMLAVHGGCERALCELMCRERHRLEGLARRILGEDPAVEDVVQEAFVAIWTRRGQYKPGKAAWPWVAQIVRNGCHQRWRRRGGRRKASRAAEVAIELAEYQVAPQGSPAAQAQQAELVKLARRSVEDLSPTYREIVQLSIFGEMGDEEIAELLGIPVGTVKSRKHRAISTLRESLARYNEIEAHETEEASS